MVLGRYLATFCSNCFGISRKLVAELVAAAILVATFQKPALGNWQIAIGKNLRAIGSWPLAKTRPWVGNLRKPEKIKAKRWASECSYASE